VSARAEEASPISKAAEMNRLRKKSGVDRLWLLGFMFGSPFAVAILGCAVLVSPAKQLCFSDFPDFCLRDVAGDDGSQILYSRVNARAVQNR
jgi:hypothetical protein